MKRLMVLSVLCAVLAASGCSAGGASSDSAPPPEARETASDAPSATPTTEAPPAATVAQWASRIAEVQGDARAAHADWEAAQCLPTDVHLDPVCQAHLLIMQLNASTVALSVEGGTMEGVPAYIGTPPAEIAGLVDETLAAAQAASESGQVAVDACHAGECTSEAFEALMDYEDLVAKIDAWSPYGV